MPELCVGRLGGGEGVTGRRPTYLLSPAVLCAAADEAGLATSAAAAAQQRSLERQAMWLVVHCEDRQGILAEVAQIIAENQFNIKV